MLIWLCLGLAYLGIGTWVSYRAGKTYSYRIETKIIAAGLWPLMLVLMVWDKHLRVILAKHHIQTTDILGWGMMGAAGCMFMILLPLTAIHLETDPAMGWRIAYTFWYIGLGFFWMLYVMFRTEIDDIFSGFGGMLIWLLWPLSVPVILVDKFKGK